MPRAGRWPRLTPPHSTQGSEPPCSAFCESFACEATGTCQFDQSTYLCSPCPAAGCPAKAACDTYTDEVECPTATCTWIFADDYVYDADNAPGTCEKLTCPDIFDASQCLTFSDFPCTWDPELYRCSTKGIALPCQEIFDPTACPSNCTFNADAGVCLPTGQPVPCNVSARNHLPLVPR